MPELPDVVLYIERMEPLLRGLPLLRVRLASPFLVRSYDPPIWSVHGKTVLGFRRMGKRIVFCLEQQHFLLLHLMIAGRLRWRPPGAKVPSRNGLAAFDFPNGTMVLTEAGTKKRASLYVVHGEAALAPYDRGGMEPLEMDIASFRSGLIRENHTLKRALTDPRIISGIGNAYSDEILHRARLSPLKQTVQLSPTETERLFHAIREVLLEWTQRLRLQTGEAWPEKVTAFRAEMAVHGKYRAPCPVCATPIQRIVYAKSETNYCATCQTGGKLLADRALSRLLRKDWPRRVEELEDLLQP